MELGKALQTVDSNLVNASAVWGTVLLGQIIKCHSDSLFVERDTVLKGHALFLGFGLTALPQAVGQGGSCHM